jgi:hypothetical protein
VQVHGACHCGSIEYDAEVEPAHVGVCHCTDCQTLSGSAFTIFAPVPKDAFRLTKGRPKIYVKTAESGARRAQAFCADCGTRIYASAELDPQRFNLRVGAIRERAQLAPRAQLWCRSALPWVMSLGSVEKLDQQPAS